MKGGIENLKCLYLLDVEGVKGGMGLFSKKTIYYKRKVLIRQK
jgi:hypothetical protein